MKEDLSQLRAGDTVWIVGAGFRRLDEGAPVPMEEARVWAVGRKYLTVRREGWQVDDQFSKDTGWEKMDNTHYSRRIYIDIHAYTQEQERIAAYEGVRKAFRDSWGAAPVDIPTDDIREAARLLRINLDKE